MNETRSVGELVEDLRATQQHRDKLVTEVEALKRRAAVGDKAVAETARAKAAFKDVEAQLGRVFAELDVAKNGKRALEADVHRLEGQLAKARKTEELIAEGVLEVRAAR